MKVALLLACDACGSAVDDPDQGMCAKCRAPRKVAPFDVAILERESGAPVGARRPSGEWIALRGGTFDRVTLCALEHIAADPNGAEVTGVYRVMTCPTGRGESLAALCSAVIASYDAVARGLFDRALAFSAFAMMLSVAAANAGADDATIVACGSAARAALRTAGAARIVS